VVGDEVLSALDSECSKAAIRLRIVHLFPHDALMDELRRARRGESGDALLGYLVSITGGSAEQYREILATLVPSDKPIAVFDQTGGATGVRLPGGRALRVFTIANSTNPGLQMGRYLLGLGHRRIAYMAPRHGDIWSVRRLEGLVEAFRAVEPDGAVVPFTDSGLGLDGRGERHAGADIQAAAHRGLRPTVPLERYIGRALTRMNDELGRQVAWASLEEAFRPAMERALADRSITAWVGASDGIALLCRAFLQEKGVRVPDELSLVGFDDSTEAFSANLTSYNFNRAAAIHAVIAYLVGSPTQRLPARQGDMVEIEGFVAPRGSSAAPRGSD
jgi:hypothetical protein